MTSYIKKLKPNVDLPTVPISPLISENLQLENFQIVWLDPKVYIDEENKETYRILQQILTDVQRFDDLALCEQWLKTYSGPKKIIFVVSGGFGEQLVPRIHNLPHIVAIDIFCLSRVYHEKWSKQFSKVLGTVTKTKDLTNQLSQYRKKLESVEDSKTIQIFQDHRQQHKNLSSTDASFLWYQLLLELLISPSYLPTNNTNNDLAQILRKYYPENKYYLDSIEKFLSKYKHESAISWLIRDTPVKRFINSTLREQNIHILFLLRFFLRDVYSRLSTRPIRTVRTYTIQFMSPDEIDYLKSNQNNYLFFAGFLYTTTVKPDLRSISIDHNQFETVLLKIDADSERDTLPFAFVDDNDVCDEDRDGSHVLFMCGSIFRIGRLHSEEKSVWTVSLTLASGDDVPILAQKKQQLRQNKNLCIIGDLLEGSKQYDKASIYYKCLLQELPLNHDAISQIEERLQLISVKKAGMFFFLIDFINIISIMYE